MKRPDPGALADELAAVLGHAFRDPGLLVRALTHPSAATAARPDNQRLEFLGDRVLGLIIAETLTRTFPDAREGELAPRLNTLVRRETLAEVATDIDLGRFLLLGRSEALSGGRRKQALLADAMEAVIAALYLDGGIEPARAFVLRRWEARINASQTLAADAKSRIQEWAQGRGLSPPIYTQLGRSGPDHAPVFRIEAVLASGERAEGRAKSKKLAEQQAAEALLVAVGAHE